MSEENDPWRLRVPDGLGPLRLGMTVGEVARFDDVYGPIQDVDEGGTAPQSDSADLGPFADYSSESERNRLSETFKGLHREREGMRTEYRRLESAIPGYRNGILVEIRTDSRCRKLNLDGDLVYAAAPDELLPALERPNGNAFALANSVMFPAVGMEAVDSTEQAADRSIRIRPADDGERRFVSLSETKRLEEAVARYAPICFSGMSSWRQRHPSSLTASGTA